MPYPSLLNAVQAAERTIGGMAVAVYRWPDRVTVRFKIEGGKTFRPFHETPAGWAPRNPPEPLKLYRSEPWRLSDDGPIWIPEGERKCDELARLGLAAVTSGSATSANVFDWTPCAGRDCCLLPDNDDPGRAAVQANGRKIAALPPPMPRVDRETTATTVLIVQAGLTKARVKIVTLPGLFPGEDIVDWLAPDGPMAEKSPADIRAALNDLAAARPWIVS
jgi:hypothetical protein